MEITDRAWYKVVGGCAVFFLFLSSLGPLLLLLIKIESY